MFRSRDGQTELILSRIFEIGGLFIILLTALVALAFMVQPEPPPVMQCINRWLPLIFWFMVGAFLVRHSYELYGVAEAIEDEA
ncbi:MAG: hypothetical protein MK108_02185 [Mariniblastus sp.]|nr:hypothetical protein [Mariniblastus sp.]